QRPGTPAPGVPASRVPVPGSPGFGIPGVAAPAALPPGAGSRAVFRTSRTAAAVWGTLTGLGALTCAAISQGASELGDRGGSFVFVVGFLVLAVPAARLLRVLILPRRWIEVAAGGITVGRGSRRRQLTWSQLARVRVVEDRHRPWLVVWPTDPPRPAGTSVPS